MTCIRLLWNLFNLIYCVAFFIFALLGELEHTVILASTILVLHIIFTLAINSRVSSDLERNDQPMSECLLVMINCFVIIASAVSIILGAANGQVQKLIPLVVYTLLIHSVCLLISCTHSKGYFCVHYLCRRKICGKCEIPPCKRRKKSVCCQKFSECMLAFLTCECCCKRKKKKGRKYRENARSAKSIEQRLPTYPESKEETEQRPQRQKSNNIILMLRTEVGTQEEDPETVAVNLAAKRFEEIQE